VVTALSVTSSDELLIINCYSSSALLLCLSLIIITSMRVHGRVHGCYFGHPCSRSLHVHRDQLRAQRWLSSMGSFYLYLLV